MPGALRTAGRRPAVKSRLTRAGYGKDEIYTRMATDSLPQWQALSAISGLPILHQCGVVFFSAVEDDYFRGTLEVHQKLGLPIERLDRAEHAAPLSDDRFYGDRNRHA